MSADPGYRRFAPDDGVRVWAEAAVKIASELARAPERRARELRHKGTWLVGLDLLPNKADGSVEGVPLPGAWRQHVPDLPLHSAQVSIVYPGYPGRDADETDPNHRYRIARKAAHVDGLLPVGPDRRRFAHEHHAYILMIALTQVRAAPTVIWEGSQVIMGNALRAAIGDHPPENVDITQAYQAARHVVFERCPMVPLHAEPGEVILIHRHALHGTEVWGDTPDKAAPDGRMTAFFRPETTPADWLRPDAPDVCTSPRFC